MSEETTQKTPAFQWYPKDYLCSLRVQCLTLAEEGAYVRCLNYAWLNGYIPNDEAAVVRLIGKGATAAIARVVMELFVVSPDDSSRLIHDRLEAERAKQAENSEMRRRAAEARWGKKRGELAEGRQMQVQTPRSAAEQTHSVSDSAPVDARAYASALQNTSLSSSSSSSSPESKKDNPIGLSKKATVRGSRLPDDFTVTDEMRAFAQTRAPDVRIDLETEKFRNYWTALAGSKGVKLDWPATWRNWMLRAQEDRHARTGRPPAQPTGSTVEFIARIGGDAQRI